MLLAASLAASVLSASPGLPVAYPDLSALVDKMGARLEQQATATMQQMQTVDVMKEELDSDGKVEHVDEEQLQSIGEGESREFRLVHATEDGKDVTAERQAKYGKHKHHAFGKKNDDDKGHGMRLQDINPFAKVEQAKYRYWVVAPLPPAGQPLHVHFEPNVEPTDKLMTGDALVDAATGTIEAIHLAPSDMPPFVDVLKMNAVLGSSGAAPAQQFDVDGAGHFLFWHKHFRVHLKFGYAPGKT